MADIVNGITVTSDQRVRLTCPVCFQVIRWEGSPQDRGSYRAHHKDCGLHFHALVANFKTMVLDEDGNELQANLEPVVVAAPPVDASQAPTDGTELVPGGLVLVKTGQPGE